MRIYNPDIRVVVYTGRGGYTRDGKPGPRFLFFGKEDFRKSDQTLKWVYGYNEPKTEDFDNISLWMPILPMTYTSSLSFDGASSMSMRFILGDTSWSTKKGQGYDKRFMYRARHPREWTDAGEVMSYLKQALVNNVIPYIDYYKHSDLFDEDYLGEDASNIGQVQEPDFIFQPSQVIWVFCKNKDGYWYKTFTGIVNSITEADSPGTQRTVIINATAPIQLFAQVPLFYKFLTTVNVAQVLPKDDEELKRFLRVYLASVFTGLESLGVDAIADLTLTEMFVKLCLALNRRVGAINREDLDISVEEVTKALEKDKKNNPIEKDPVKGAGVGLGVITEQDKISYMKQVEEYGAFKFKIFSPKVESIKSEDKEKLKIEQYQGNNLKIGDGENEQEKEMGRIGVEELFEDVSYDGSVYQINSLGKVYLGKDFYDGNGDIPSVFQNMIKFSINWYNPINTAMSNLIRQIQGALLINIFNDPGGNLILEYPQFNAYPKLRNFSTPDDAFYDSYYEDHNEKYVLHKFRTTDFSFTTDTSNYVTFLKLPMRYKAIDNLKQQVTDSSLMTGYSWATPAEILRFGINELTMQQLYVTIGQLAAKKIEDEPEEAYEIRKPFLVMLADAFRYRYNADVYSGSASLKFRSDFLPGRNVFIPHKEMMYMVTRVNTSVTPGRSFDTRLDLAAGHTLDKEFPNPWKYFQRYVEKLGGSKSKLCKEVCKQIFKEKVTPKQKNVMDESIVVTEENVYAKVREALPLTDPLLSSYLRSVVANVKGSSFKVGAKSKRYSEHEITANPRLLVNLAAAMRNLDTWARTQGYRRMIYHISSLKRNDKGVSRHNYGNAADINEIEYLHPDTGDDVHTIKLRAAVPVGTENKDLAEKLVSIFVGLGHTLSNKSTIKLHGGNRYCEWDYKKDFVLWDAIDCKSGSDPYHIRHIHVSVGRDVL